MNPESKVYLDVLSSELSNHADRLLQHQRAIKEHSVYLVEFNEKVSELTGVLRSLERIYSNGGETEMHLADKVDRLADELARTREMWNSLQSIN